MSCEEFINHASLDDNIEINECTFYLIDLESFFAKMFEGTYLFQEGQFPFFTQYYKEGTFPSFPFTFIENNMHGMMMK
jgi:predicted ferric reductase